MGREPQWVCATVLGSPEAAQVARSAMDAHGIPCYVRSDNVAGALGAMTLTNRGVELHVPAEHLTEAREILQVPSSAPPAERRRRVAPAVVVLALVLLVLAVGVLVALDVTG